MAASTVPAHVAPAYVTLDAFYAMRAADELPKLSELSHGQIVVPPFATADHGYLVRAVFIAMYAHAQAYALGECFGDGFGYELPVPNRPDTYRVPDSSFVRADRVPRRGRSGRVFAIAPDVAVEIRSPSDKPGVLRNKLADYLDAGTAAVWIVDPDTCTVEVHAPGVPVRRLGESDVLDGGAAFPGFTLPLARLFAELDG